MPLRLGCNLSPWAQSSSPPPRTDRGDPGFGAGLTAGIATSFLVASTFNVTLNVPNLTSEGVKTVLDKIRAVSAQELEAATNLLDNTGIGTGLPVKKLLLLVEMARQRSSSEDVVPFSYLVECMQDLAL